MNKYYIPRKTEANRRRNPSIATLELSIHYYSVGGLRDLVKNKECSPNELYQSVILYGGWETIGGVWMKKYTSRLPRVSHARVIYGNDPEQIYSAAKFRQFLEKWHIRYQEEPPREKITANLKSEFNLLRRALRNLKKKITN